MTDAEIECNEADCPLSRTDSLFRLVGAAELALHEVHYLAAQKIAAQRRQMVGEDLALDMVVLVLDYARRQSVELLVMLDEILVEVAHADSHRTAHVLVDARQRKAALLEEVGLLAALVNPRIDEHAAIVGERRVFIAPRSAVDDEHTDVLADLRSGKPYPARFGERQEHVVHEFLEIGIRSVDIDRLIAQYGRTVDYYRINHTYIYYYISHYQSKQILRVAQNDVNFTIRHPE